MADLGHELTEKELAKLEKKIAKEYKTATREMEAKLTAYLEKTEAQRQVQESLLKAGKITKKEYSDWCYRHTMIGNQWAAMRDVLAEDMVNANKIAKGMMMKQMPDIYALNANYATYQIEHDYGIDTGFTLYNHDTAAYLLGDQRQLMPAPSPAKAKQIAANKDMQWNQQHIQSAVLQGVLQGESPYQVAHRLENVGQMNYNSAVRYARTMTTSAQNAGRYESYRRAKGLGVDLTIEWQATLDHRTRHAHRMMHGQRTEVDEPFHTPDGFTIYYPADCTGESTAPQSEIWNCRCTLLAWVKGYEGETVKSAPAMDGMSFEEWQNEKQQTSKSTAQQSFTSGGDPYIMKREAVLANAQEFSYSYHEQYNFDEDNWNKLSRDEQYAVETYTGNTYRRMNTALRGTDRHGNEVIPSDDIQKYNTNCENALNTMHLKEDTILYRGMGSRKTLANSLGITERELKEAFDDGSIVGMSFVEKGFSSTGITGGSGWDKPVTMTVYAPKGTAGMFVDPISRCQGENELLLQHHTWFEITGAEIREDDWGDMVLHLDVYAFKQTPEDYQDELLDRMKRGVSEFI